MKELSAHRDHPNMVGLTVRATDYPGPGGTHHRYVITGFDLMSNPSGLPDVNQHSCTVVFQNGAIKDVGINGVTDEALLAIVADRVGAFQSGPYACRENAIALDGLHVAMQALKSRTARRTGQGIEGTMAKDPVDAEFVEKAKDDLPDAPTVEFKDGGQGNQGSNAVTEKVVEDNAKVGASPEPSGKILD